MNEQSSSSFVPSHDDIARRAADLWRSYGAPQGRDDEIWLEAERQLKSTAKAPLAAEDQPTVNAAATREAAPAPANKITSKEAELMEKNSSTVPTRPKSKAAKVR